MTQPADQHVNTHWSRDTERGAMDATCARVVALGLPAVAFTEHVDVTPFRAGVMAERVPHLVEDGIIHPPRCWPRARSTGCSGRLHCLPDGDAYAEP